MSSGGRIEKRQHSRPVSPESALRQKGVSAGWGWYVVNACLIRVAHDPLGAIVCRRQDRACAHSHRKSVVLQRAVGGAAKPLPNERCPKRASSGTAEDEAPCALSSCQGGRSKITARGRVGLEPHAGSWGRHSRGHGWGMFGVIRAAGISARKDPPRLSGFRAIA